MMGLPDGYVTAVPGIGRSEAYRLLGNGVVWQQAAHAIRLLLARHTLAGEGIMTTGCATIIRAGRTKTLVNDAWPVPAKNRPRAITSQM